MHPTLENLPTDLFSPSSVSSPHDDPEAILQRARANSQSGHRVPVHAQIRPSDSMSLTVDTFDGPLAPQVEPALPDDILELIVQTCSRFTLWRCCLVNQALYRLAVIHLYISKTAKRRSGRILDYGVHMQLISYRIDCTLTYVNTRLVSFHMCHNHLYGTLCTYTISVC